MEALHVLAVRSLAAVAGIGAGRCPSASRPYPALLVVYLSIPFYLVPNFIPVLGYLDDVALAMLALVLIIKLTPRQAVLSMLEEAQGDGPSPAPKNLAD